MIVPVVFALGALLSFGFAAPQLSQSSIKADVVPTETISATLSLTFTSTLVTTFSPSPTETASPDDIVYNATELYAFRPGAPFHLMPFQASGMFFQLGGDNAAYCPTFVEELGGCPNLNITGFESSCSLSTLVPGGQAIYLAPDGSLRYTQAHSQYTQPGSIICPMTFTQACDSDASQVMISGFGATGFMACPMLTSKRVRQHWQVYANIPNAGIPLRNGNISTCWNFEVFGIEKQIGHNPAAWQYF